MCIHAPARFVFQVGMRRGVFELCLGFRFRIRFKARARARFEFGFGLSCQSDIVMG